MMAKARSGRNLARAKPLVAFLLLQAPVLLTIPVPAIWQSAPEG